MKIFLTFFVLSFSTSVFGDIFFEDKTDKFTGIINQQIIDPIGESITVEKSNEVAKGKTLSFSYVSIDDTSIAQLLVFISYNNSNESSTNNAYVLLDDVRWNVHDFDIETENTGNGILEVYSFLYNPEDFKKILSAKEFGFKVGDLIVYIDLTMLPLSKFEI